MKDYCLIIKRAEDNENIFSPIQKAKLNQVVWYENPNGNWYRGRVVRELEKVIMPLVPPPNNYRMAVTVDCGDLVLLLDENQLFELHT
jgi:hypothetical protein